MKTLGTILPCRRQLAIADAHADRMAKAREDAAQSQVKGLDRRVVGGEVRYYDTTDQYAIVSRQGKLIWFAVRDDGDYRI